MKGEPITITTSDILKINGFGYWEGCGFFVNANIKGYEPCRWCEIPFITEAAKKEATERGVGLGDVADLWNEKLSEAEPKPFISATWTYDQMTPEGRAWFDELAQVKWSPCDEGEDS